MTEAQRQRRTYRNSDQGTRLQRVNCGRRTGVRDGFALILVSGLVPPQWICINYA
jgi:hypothetical protein